MILSEILTSLEHKILKGNKQVNINYITTDSRKVQKDSLFMCYKGYRFDSHNFIHEALNKGAVAVIVEKEIDINLFPDWVTFIKVQSTRNIISYISNQFYNIPSKSFKLIGVTGTNGKSSFCHILAKLLEENNKKIGLIGTNEIRIGKKILVKGKRVPTIPANEELQEILFEMKKKEVEYVLIEVSSIALLTKRVDGLEFDLGVFTNLSKDHLNRHGSMYNYFKAKKKLFGMCKVGLFNNDDDYAEKMKEELNCDITTYGIYKNSDYFIKYTYTSETSQSFVVTGPAGDVKIETSLLGEFNAYNILSAYAAFKILNLVESVCISETIKNIRYIPGRLQHIEGHKQISVYIDYAHSPKALENVYKTISQNKKGNIITVFSHGYNRDKSIRSSLGEIILLNSNNIIITSNNYSEEKFVKEIYNDLFKEAPSSGRAKVISNRFLAIKSGVEQAQENDTVLVIGNGSNQYSVYHNCKKVMVDDEYVINSLLDFDKKGGDLSKIKMY